MIVTLEITDATKREIQAAADRPSDLKGAIVSGLRLAAAVGANVVVAALQGGRLGLTMRNPANGLAASVNHWMISEDPDAPVAAMGVPSNAPAAAYARIQETGGTIRPRNARALAVPISAEAARHASPRDMDGLELIPRRGRPPLLVRKIESARAKARWILHWVLLPSVTLRATHWLTNGARLAKDDMRDAFAEHVLDELELR